MKKSKQLVTKQIELHLGELNKLSDSVASLLQIDRNIHTLWVSIKRNKLLLMTDDSSFATQLRFQQALIQQHINQKLLTKVKEVKIKVIAAKPQAYEQVKEKCFRISSQTAKVLSYIAEDIDDKELRESLRRLGR
ncbi:MAG TPA: DUF721 domain-containing protein [Leucothrix mucor]|uniref:DUF721 domain-containing protein n=1 Tax=Leucothrix mucor TaxID=45248 RepID=A0A7V2WU35_LEUMU|nr:DUF721 domain-containing protein [Leucothrix mucor]